MSIQVTTLIENGRLEENLLCEAGLSFLIQTNDQKILFDTGATSAFIDNAESMNIDLSKIDYVVLSHAHYDHSGGLRSLCHSTRRKFELILNPNFFNKKFLQHSNDYLTYIGNDFSEEFLQVENIKTTFPLTDLFELGPQLYIMSNFELVCDFEPRSPEFLVLKCGEYKLDYFTEEQVLIIKTTKGLILVTGCAHSGIVNICESVRKSFKEPIHAILGGLHLMNSDMDRIAKTAQYFKDIGVQKLGACHCTGEVAKAYFAVEGPEFIEMPSGKVTYFDFD
jgi:7,8-dihydropterin-6-yl-methyl-4-(beta-D-ribofuranosyl)aminobenzene 5'-phosphate synthase